MDSLLGVAGFLVAGAATPGPNNLVVWHAVSHRGFVRALPAIAGIVLGGLVLLGLTMSGVDALLATAPVLRVALTMVGCGYLAWLGIGLFVSPLARGGTGFNKPRSALPEGFGGLFLFQFLNPKGWVLLATAGSALTSKPPLVAYAQVAGLFTVISLVCLGLWAMLGQWFAAVDRGPRLARWFDRLMGCLLIGSAALLLSEI